MLEKRVRISVLHYLEEHPGVMETISGWHDCWQRLIKQYELRGRALIDAYVAMIETIADEEKWRNTQVPCEIIGRDFRNNAEGAAKAVLALQQAGIDVEYF